MSNHNGRYALEKRRAQENTYRSMESSISEDRRAFQIAQFETSSMVKIDDKMRKQRTQDLRSISENKLLNRKQNLADLYNYEMDNWRSEVMGRVETQEDRKARIIERAYALRDAREEERKKFVQEKYNDQWRDACDDARALDSKALTVHMSKERISQIQEKIARRQQLNNDENLIMAEWNRQLEIANQRDIEKKALHHRADMETAQGLKSQMANNVQRKDDEYLRMQREASEELADIREAMMKESEKMKKRQDEAHARGRDMNIHNQQYKILEAEEARIQRQHDKILLDYALIKEKELDQADNYKKQVIKASAIQYTRYLKEQSIKEAEDNTFIDDARKREEERVWKTRDDALQIRQDSRDYLMRMVDDGRQEQIRSKNDSVLRAKQDDQLFATKFVADAKENIEKEKLDAIRRRNISLNNNDKLQDQIAYRREKEEIEKQEIYLADKRMKYIERTHQQRLADQGGALRTNFPLKNGQWYS